MNRNRIEFFLIFCSNYYSRKITRATKKEKVNEIKTQKIFVRWVFIFCVYGD